jgi:hypothetical protein
MAGNPDVVYRAFKGTPEHLVELPTGGFRLKSSWFRVTGGGVSVDDGEFGSAEETYERNKPCGVASVSKATLATEGFAITKDPEDTDEELARNPGHRIVPGVGSKHCRRITATAVIEIYLEGWQVVGASGSAGRAPRSHLAGVQ